MRTKYPRTFHLPWSPGATSDDKVHPDVEGMFQGHEVVMTEKMDGENTTIYSDGYCHARSVDSARHSSRDWVKANVAPLMVGNLPEGWRVCGENLYAKHSLGYDKLPSYFLVFSIWDENNRCLSWEETVEWCRLLGLHEVPVLYQGPWDPEKVQNAWKNRKSQSFYGEEGEGYVVRKVQDFGYEEFATSLAKYVRPNHVVTGDHWMYSEVIPNQLGEGA